MPVRGLVALGALVAVVLTAAILLWPRGEPASAEGTRIVGDVNSDGTVDSRDAFHTLGFQAGIIFPRPYPDKYYDNGDVNRDGIVNGLDALLILQYDAGLIDRLPPPNRGPGDVNCDGSVDSIDSELILQLNARLVRLLPCQENGDVNGDGRIDSIDAVLLIQFVVHPLSIPFS